MSRTDGISPRALDFLCNGLPVYIRRQPATGKAYATLYDFSKLLNEPPLKVIRKRFTTVDELRAYDPETDREVIKALEVFNT